ncbi:MAG: hypothetical protein V7K14_15475 [Nostoc sp.]|uniref:hypothetical protein n=1 Tax=Nostoc sp. TaxID=1180 RepID=UPI002FF9481F
MIYKYTPLLLVDYQQRFNKVEISLPKKPVNIRCEIKTTLLNKTLVNLLKAMKTKFQITKFMIFFIGAYILISEIAACPGMLSIASANAFSATKSNILITGKVNSQNLKEIYIAPNYGGPDSQHGSGTR